MVFKSSGLLFRNFFVWKITLGSFAPLNFFSKLSAFENTPLMLPLNKHYKIFHKMVKVLMHGGSAYVGSVTAKQFN